MLWFTEVEKLIRVVGEDGNESVVNVSDHFLYLACLGNGWC